MDDQCVGRTNSDVGQSRLDRTETSLSRRSCTCGLAMRRSAYDVINQGICSFSPTLEDDSASDCDGAYCYYAGGRSWKLAAFAADVVRSCVQSAIVFMHEVAWLSPCK